MMALREAREIKNGTLTLRKRPQNNKILTGHD